MSKVRQLSDIEFGKIAALYEVRDFILANMPAFVGRRWAKKLEAHCAQMQADIKSSSTP
jgi:hypothetical protein